MWQFLTMWAWNIIDTTTTTTWDTLYLSVYISKCYKYAWYARYSKMYNSCTICIQFTHGDLHVIHISQIKFCFIRILLTFVVSRVRWASVFFCWNESRKKLNYLDGLGFWFMIFFKILSLTSYFRDEQNSSNFQLPQREAGNTHESRAVIRKEQEVKPLPAGKNK